MKRFSRTFAQSTSALKIIECPRDAIQGLKEFVPTHKKITFINALLRCGFDTIDFGSFVSMKVPQMRDTAEVLAGLDMSNTTSKLLAIVANKQGAEIAASFPEIRYVGFPLSVSETFQIRNTKMTIPQAVEELREIHNIVTRAGKETVTYLSMAFGNPYKDPYSEDVVLGLAQQVADMKVPIISLADTVGLGKPELISRLFTAVISKHPEIEVGGHFHSHPATAQQKISAAFNAGCRRLDGAVGGMGGCPFSQDTLVGNVATEAIVSFLDVRGIPSGIHRPSLEHVLDLRLLMFGATVKELVLAAVLRDDKAFNSLIRCHFDAADKSQNGVLGFLEFGKIFEDSFRELGENTPSPEKIAEVFHRYADKNGQIGFEAYSTAARTTLHKRMGDTYKPQYMP